MAKKAQVQVQATSSGSDQVFAALVLFRCDLKRSVRKLRVASQLFFVPFFLFAGKPLDSRPSAAGLPGIALSWLLQLGLDSCDDLRGDCALLLQILLASRSTIRHRASRKRWPLWVCTLRCGVCLPRPRVDKRQLAMTQQACLNSACRMGDKKDETRR